MSTKVVVVQTPPVLFHCDKTIAKVLLSIDEVVEASALLISGSFMEPVRIHLGTTTGRAPTIKRLECWRHLS